MAETSRPLVRNQALALLLAFAAAMVVYSTWGGLDRPGLFHDEKAYLFQARTYTTLHWTQPTPPVPELWEQVHVFVEPRYASKYPPGFPAVLALGAAVGLPGLIPILLAAGTAALLFVFGARVVGRWPAFAASALWVASPVNTTWRAAYFSESLTCLLWLAWSWCAWTYRRDGGRRFLVATSVLVVFAGITRPVTGIALAAPLVWVLWPRLRAAAGRRDAVMAFAAGLALCAVVPVWNHAVLGSWRAVPYAAYSAHTFPFDMPGLRTDYSPPTRELPADLVALADEQRAQYDQRSVARMPIEYVRRLDRLAADALPPSLSALRYVAPFGLLAAGGVGVAALASVLLLVLAHITMPHTPNWTIYYLDVFPVVAFGVVVALMRGGAYVVARARGVSLLQHADVAALASGIALLAAGATMWAPVKVERHGWMRREVAFRAGLCALPPGPKLVFVTPRPNSSPHHILLDNDPAWRDSDVWVVRTWDVARHRALLEAAQGRAAYHYDEQNGWFAPMPADGAVPAPPGVLHVLQTDARRGRGITCP